MRVRDVMSQDVVALSEDDTLDLAEMEMKLARVRHLPVVREDKLVGLLTHRDLLRASCSAVAELSDAEQKAILRSIPVREVMRRQVVTAEPEDDLRAVGRVMRDGKIGCVPVVEEGTLVGIITEADFLELALRFLDAIPEPAS